MLEEFAMDVLAAMTANVILLSTGYFIFDRKRKQSMKRLYERTAGSITRTVNRVLDVTLDELLAFLYLSKAITGKEIEKLVITKNTIQRENKQEYIKFRNQLLGYLNTDDVFALLISAKHIPPTFWIPVSQALRNFNAEAHRCIDIFETTGSFDELDYLTELRDLSDLIMSRLTLLHHPESELARMGIENIRVQVFGEMRSLISACLNAAKVFREEELTYKPTIKPG